MFHPVGQPKASDKIGACFMLEVNQRPGVEVVSQTKRPGMRWIHKQIFILEIVSYSMIIWYLSNNPIIPADENFAFFTLFDSRSME